MAIKVAAQIVIAKLCGRVSSYQLNTQENGTAAILLTVPYGNDNRLENDFSYDKMREHCQGDAEHSAFFINYVERLWHCVFTWIVPYDGDVKFTNVCAASVYGFFKRLQETDSGRNKLPMWSNDHICSASAPSICLTNLLAVVTCGSLWCCLIK